MLLHRVNRGSPKSRTLPVSRCAPWLSLPQSCRGGIGKQYAVTHYVLLLPSVKAAWLLVGGVPQTPENRSSQGVNKSREFRVIRLPARRSAP
ncbi:hypothetical protein [Nostoc foliaceum]|uniref:Uncharacterized protein n=1 Tax=Nostoc foliaceum FACHB-393 TaxID=2692915 RepID=A0ABR8IKF6_9NOSO|nr:hypothetical protein [Nostoc foliaceum]MBD2651296.1 hypothetical protein [Nostoc foliaceum FACHB-393]